MPAFVTAMGRVTISARIRLLVGLLALLGGWSSAQADNEAEYRLKAAFLYNFAKYVEWPPGRFASPNAPLLICLAGANPFGDALAALSGKTVDGHPVEVRHLPAATDLDPCHIVFVSRVERERFKMLLGKLARLPILTVSDIDDFARMGGMIGLVDAERGIQFAINLTVARQANLKLSSQLLKLATVVL